MIEDELEALLGERPVEVRPTTGGLAADALRVQLPSRLVFVKRAVPAGSARSLEASNASALLESEARSLRWLADAGGASVVTVFGATPSMLVVSWVEQTEPTRAAAEALGRGLAAMHRAGAPAFGADWAGFIGPLAQDNGPFAGWPSLYRQRVLPFAQMALERGALDTAGLAAVGTVMERLERLVPEEPPSRVHGDLWSGNVLWAADGAWLIDASAHGGHRETDLAMLALFGAPFLAHILSAYDEVFPLADGWRDRVALHQLHPLLVHAALFGGGYGRRAAESARGYC